MTTQESPEAESLAAAGSWPVPAISPTPGPTPAVRGYPGGSGLPETGLPDGEPGAGRPAARPAGSPWQSSHQAWLDAGADWLRQPGWLPESAWLDPARHYRLAGPEQRKPVGADWDHTEPIPIVRTAGGRTARRGAKNRGRPAPAARPAARGRPAAPATAAGGPRRAALAPAAGGLRRAARGRRPVAAVAGVVALAAAIVVVTVVQQQPHRTTARPGLLPGYPPARLADAVFTGRPGPAGPGLLPSLATVAVSGTTVIAAGSQVGPPARRPVILVSADGGATWRQASLQAPGGDVPAGAVPFLLAGGAGGWLAVGGQAAWASATGQSWHLEPGIPLHPGDRVLGLARTATGFLAVGSATQPGAPGRASAVLWTSPDGAAWQRRTAARLGLHAGTRRVAALDQVAASGNTVVVTGGFAAAGSHLPGGATPAVRAWRSGDGGATWAPVRLPAGHGGTGPVSGLAPDRSGFVLIRPGHTLTGQPVMVSYQSASGLHWQFAGVLAGTGHSALRVTGVTGNSHGTVVTATETARRAHGATVAFLTRTGRSWQQVTLLPDAAAGSLAGAVPGAGGVVVAAGSARPAPVAGPAAGPGTAAAAAGPRPFLLLAGQHRTFVGQRALASAASSGVAVTALASAGGREVAAGSAGGVPMIWTALAGGRWAADPPGTWAVPGVTLTGITHGSDGWLAIGRKALRGQSRLVLLTSRDALSWQAVPGLRALISKGTVITQAAAGPGGYVLVGEQVAVRRPAAVAWWSASPGAWTQAAGTAIPSPAPGRAARPPSRMLAVTTGGPGFVAAGSSGSRPAVWSSQDGRSWTAGVLPVPAGAQSALLQRVAAHGQRVTAVGTELTPAGSLPFAAVSADGGRTWREFRLPLPACQPGGTTAAPAAARVTAIVAAGGGFVATGTCGVPGQLDVVVWSSGDGQTWTAAVPHRPGLSGPGAQQITALTVGGRSLTGAGFTATPAGEHPTLWRLRVR